MKTLFDSACSQFSMDFEIKLETIDVLILGMWMSHIYSKRIIDDFDQSNQKIIMTTKVQRFVDRHFSLKAISDLKTCCSKPL